MLRIPNCRSGDWPEPPIKAMVVPLIEQGGTSSGFLVAALNRYRPINEMNRGFVRLVAAYIAAAIGSARSYRSQQRRAEDLAELDRAKTTFFSNISHEFRTPLTLILDPVAELRGRSSGLDDRTREDLDIVWRNGLRLSKLVNTLLDFSRIEAGRAQARYRARRPRRVSPPNWPASSGPLSNGPGWNSSSSVLRWTNPSTSIATCGRRWSSTCCRTH